VVSSFDGTPVPVKRHRGEPGHWGTGKKTPGGAGTHTGHTGHADAQRPSDHTDEPHNHPKFQTHQQHTPRTSAPVGERRTGYRTFASPVKRHRHRGEPEHTQFTRNVNDSPPPKYFPNCELAAGPLGLRNHTVGSHHNLGFELLEHCTVVESVGLVLSALRALRGSWGSCTGNSYRQYRYLPRACLPAPPGVFKPPIVQYSTFRRARASFQIFSDAHSHSRTSSYRYVSEK
jgi:hypothetical protein